MLRHLPLPDDDRLVVGHEHSDDAAVWRLDDGRLLVASVDFFAPVVDDARMWGQIAAANAASDVYAMGGRPLFGLNVAAWPRDMLPLDLLADVLAGGARTAARGGWLVVGGHTVDGPEPMYGMAVVGEIVGDLGPTPDRQHAAALHDPRTGRALPTGAVGTAAGGDAAAAGADDSGTASLGAAKTEAAVAFPGGGTDDSGFAPPGVLSNAGAAAGEVLILTKPLGTGLVSTAIKHSEPAAFGVGEPWHEAYAQAVREMTRLNDHAARAARAAHASAVTDVTGFGLLGHLFEMCAASGTSADVQVDAVPLLAGAADLIAAGFAPGGTQRNLDFLDTQVEGGDDTARLLLADPQTSGGLLIACDRARAADALALLESTGHTAAVIGTMQRARNRSITLVGQLSAGAG